LRSGVYLGMFEQSLILDSRHTAQKASALAVSLTTQIAVAGALLLIPLIYTERLSPGAITLPAFLPLPPPPPPAPMSEEPVARRPTGAHRIFPGIFVPARIPPLNPIFVDEPDSGPVGIDVGPPIATGPLPILAILAPPPPEPRVAEPEAPVKPLVVSGSLQAAKLIRKVVPAYPEIAKRARVSGTVHLLGIVGRDGRIEQLQVLSGPALLAQAAVDAVKQWVYSPTLLNGKPVEVSAPIDVIFALTQ